jgi:hypothetical protein
MLIVPSRACHPCIKPALVGLAEMCLSPILHDITHCICTYAGQIIGGKLEKLRLEHKAQQAAAIARGDIEPDDTPLVCVMLKALINPWEDHGLPSALDSTTTRAIATGAGSIRDKRGRKEYTEISEIGAKATKKAWIWNDPLGRWAQRAVAVA